MSEPIKAPSVATLFGVLTRAGTFQIRDEEATGLLISMEMADIRAAQRLPMYCRVAVVAADELAALQNALEVAQRDAGLYAATLQLTAHHLGCEAHMVDHEVKRLLPNTKVRQEP